MAKYYEKWRLRLNVDKTEVSAFHLNNHMANETLNIELNNETIRHNSQPKYLGNNLDRSLRKTQPKTEVEK